ncbi:MAG: sigma-54 dependent transcriptional regulator [Myxococcota bacterium]
MDSTSRSKASLLVVEDDRAMRELLIETLREEGYRVEAASGGRAAAERVRGGGFDLVITDLKMPDIDGLDLLREVRSIEGAPHVVTITAFGSIETAIKAMKLGAYHYLTKPFDPAELCVVVQRALDERRLHGEVVTLRRELAKNFRLDNLIGHSGPMQEIFDLVRRLAPAMTSVLVTGESGTGKELVAKALHGGSGRVARKFVAVNCAAIPDTLLESELFGYKRGAFTDARTDRAGLFVEADGGTLFLDEIGDLSPALQAKLLRVLQDKEVRPLGSTRSEKVDVRMLAATNRDLEQRMREGLFREDLFYRLNVVQIHLPALRDRVDDILPLSEHFLRVMAARAGRPQKRFSPACAKALLAHHWPGNVRELENVMERAVALSEGELIEPDDLPTQVRERRASDPMAGALARGLTLADVEREYIERVLHAEGGNKTRAAQRLGLDRKTLYRKLEEYARAGSGAASSADTE